MTQPDDKAPTDRDAGEAPTAAVRSEKPAAALTGVEAPHVRTARRFWILSIVNWAVAIVCWGVSSYLGAAQPASMLLYTILFLVAIVAVVVGFVCWLIAKFGTEPRPVGGGAH